MPSTYYAYRHRRTTGEGRETVWEGSRPSDKAIMKISRTNGQIMHQRHAHERRRARLADLLGPDYTAILSNFHAFVRANYPQVPDDDLATVLAQAHEGLAWTRDYNYRAGRLAGRKAKAAGKTRAKRRQDDPFWTKHFRSLVGVAGGRLKARFILIAEDADETWLAAGRPTGARSLVVDVLPGVFKHVRKDAFNEGFDAALNDRAREPDKYDLMASDCQREDKPVGVLKGASLRTPAAALTPEQAEARASFLKAQRERTATMKTDARANAVHTGEWSIYVTDKETGEQKLLTYPCFWIEVDPATTTYKKVGFPRTAGLKPSERNMPSGPCSVVWSDA